MQVSTLEVGCVRSQPARLIIDENGAVLQQNEVDAIEEERASNEFSSTYLKAGAADAERVVST